MIDIKTPQELAIMEHGGKILADVLFEVVGRIKPGVSELEVDKWAEELILARGGYPGFKKVPGYHHTICSSTNDVVVHGIPGSYRYKEGDIAGVDCGVFYKGFHTDMSETILVSTESSKLQSQKYKAEREFLQNGKRALEEAIKVAVVGNHIGDISKKIQSIVEGGGYSVVRELIGHGVGRELHEEPEVPGYLVGSIKKTPILKEGMTIAIEVIYNRGDKKVSYRGDDEWTIVTTDGSISGVFERTVAITKAGPKLITA